jgi:hypothetical protein
MHERRNPDVPSERTASSVQLNIQKAAKMCPAGQPGNAALGEHRLSLDHLAFLEQQINAIDNEVLQLIEREGYQESFQLLKSIPGVQEIRPESIRQNRTSTGTRVLYRGPDKSQ